MLFHHLPASEWRVIDRRDVREEGAFDSLPARLFVRFADGRAGAHQPIPVQCDILAGVLFTVRLQPGHVLRPFDSGGCLICISLALFRRGLIQLACSVRNRASSSFSRGDSGASCSFSRSSCLSDICLSSISSQFLLQE
jgi:hypothetical protein